MNRYLKTEGVTSIKNKILFAVIAVLLCFVLAVPLLAAEENEQYADALNTLGFFNGTGNGYELSRTPTRAEALVMLIRLLGKEQEAVTEKNTHPFTDAGWADAYIGYAYKKNLVKGISDDEFGASLPMTSQQFATLLMRALGYSDDIGGQFTYDGAYEFALHKLAIDGDAEFTRGTLAKMSYAALATPIAFSEKTLAQTLMSGRVFTQGDYSQAKAMVATEQTTTVIVYAVASDLESKLGMFSMDIDEIINASPNGINIVVQVGGTSKYRNENLADGKTQRFLLTDGKLTLLETLDDAKMCERETLVDFLRFATEKAPADRYVLVFWDHGEGTIGGFGRDELNENAALSLSDLKYAFEQTDEFFDIIVFDACLMGTVECAYALKDAGEYMIASEDIVPTDGLYYTTWLRSLSVDKTLSTAALAKMIADAYIVHAPVGREDVMLSVIRLDRVGTVVKGIEREFEKISKNPALMKKLSQLSLKPFGANSGNDQYDILSVFGELDVDVSTIGTDLENVIYYKRSAVPGKYSGLALYLPLIRDGEFEKVEQDLFSIGYPESILNVLGKLN